MKIKRFENIILEGSTIDMEKIIPFGEWRKGSTKYGDIVNRIMMYLRLYKIENESIVLNLDEFLKETNIKLDELKEFLNSEEIKRLIDFDIKIEGDNIYFTDLNRSKNIDHLENKKV